MTCPHTPSLFDLDPPANASTPAAGVADEASQPPHPEPAAPWSPPDVDTENLLEGLNPEQREAVEHRGSALLVVAGPGSGKTRVLTHRIASLVAEGTPPWKVLAVTFTNKAADEMRDRLGGLLGDDSANRMWVSTFHSACVRILRREHAVVGLSSNFVIYDADDANRILRAVLSELDMVAEAMKPSEVKKAAQKWSSMISNVKNDDGDFVAAAHELDMPDLPIVAAAYQRKLESARAVDFDDLLLYARDVLRHPEASQRWTSRFSHVLVDEYQDTNLIQLDIVARLVGDGTGFCAVGDLQQSIYSWRGARPDGLEEFAEAYENAKIVKLGRNYRSTPEILDVCQRIIDESPSRYHLELSTPNPSGTKPQLWEFGSDHDEAREVSRWAQRGGTNIAERAVVVRTHAQTRRLEEALNLAGVPYRMVGALRFYERAEVKDALAWVRVCHNPYDIVSATRTSSSPRRGLGAKSWQTVLDSADHTDGNLAEAARTAAMHGSSRGRDAISGWLADVNAAASASTAAGPVEALDVILHDVGLVAHWAKAEGGEDRVANLDQLRTSAQEWFDSGGVTTDGRKISDLTGAEATAAWLEHVALVSAADEITGDAMSIMTGHAAKGLEFDHVWVAGVEDGFFPHSRSNTAAAIDEERRLLFVACSRPRMSLNISWCQERFMFGEPRLQNRSPFLEGLGDVVTHVSAGSDVVRPRNARSSTQKWRTRPVPQFRPRNSRPLEGVPAAKVKPPAGPRIEVSQLREGLEVEHTSFGPGRISRVSGTTVEVVFVSGTRTLDAKLAPMRVAAS